MVSVSTSYESFEVSILSLKRPKHETGPNSFVRSPTRQVEVCPNIYFQHMWARTYTYIRSYGRPTV